MLTQGAQFGFALTKNLEKIKEKPYFPGETKPLLDFNMIFSWFCCPQNRIFHPVSLIRNVCQVSIFSVHHFGGMSGHTRGTTNVGIELEALATTGVVSTRYCII